MSSSRSSPGSSRLHAGFVAALLAVPLAQAMCAPPGSSRHPSKYFTDPQRQDLRAIMSRTMNASLTRISVFLFHPEDAPEGSPPFPEIEKAALTIEAGAGRLAEIRGRDDAAAFRSYAVRLRDAAEALRNAAHQGDRPSTIHWFEHVEQSCANCHRIFRFGEGDTDR